MERENAFADMGRFLRSEKDVRPYWETQHRGTVLPLVKSGYNDSVEYGVPAILGGQGWQTMSDIVSGRPVSKDEISAGATDVAGAAMTGSFGFTRPQGSLGSGGRELDKLGFFSQALETAKGLQPKASLEQYIAAMRNKGVKQGEIEATNLANAFEAKQPVTRDQLVDYLRKNRVELDETKYAGSNAENRIEIVGRPWFDDEDGTRITSQTVSAGDREYTARYDRDAGNAWVEGPDGEYIAATGRMNRQTLENAYEAIRALTAKAGVPDDARGPAYYSHHSLDETNPSYSENILSLAPSRRIAEIEARMAENERVIRGINEQAKDLTAKPDFAPLRAARSENANLYNELKQIKSGWFRSGHFDEPNIIGHTQNSIVQHDGRPVYLMDQVQSDWGQRLEADTKNAIAQQLFGRRFQVLTPDERKQVSAAKQAGDKPAGARDEAKIAELTSQIRALDDAMAQERRAIGSDIFGDEFALPPSFGDSSRFAVRDWFEGKISEAGSDFARREKIAKAGNDYIARLSDLDRMRAELRTATAAAPAHPLVNTTDQWLNTLLRRNVLRAIEQNADYIGVPSGETVLMYNPGKEHGMNAFYDQIVPKNLAAILSKLDKDGMSRIIADGLATPGNPDGAGGGFTLFGITPRMREEARKGLPLFSAGVPMQYSAPAYDETIY